MPPEAEAIFTTIIPSTKSLTIGFFGYLIPAMIGLIIAIWTIKWGWSSIIGIMKSDGKPVTFGSPLGYHGGDVYKNGHNVTVDNMFSHGKYRKNDDIYGSLQNNTLYFGVAGSEMNEYVKKNTKKL
jgi:hypothetical protein